MRFSFALLLLAVSSSQTIVSAFAPVTPLKCATNTATTTHIALASTVEVAEEVIVVDSVAAAAAVVPQDQVQASRLTESEINARQGIQMEKLQAKDQTSTQLCKEDIQTVYEDDDLLVVDKPSGVLSVPGKIVNPSLAQTVFDAVGCEMGRMDMMVVHRLGMDTSGLMIFAKTMDALRGMNEVFRTRTIERKYEALVCGHVEKDSGIIDLPLMRDYEFPPFMRVSTELHQHALVDLDIEKLSNSKLLEMPKDSVTKYEVVSREEIDGQPVTRVALTSMSGRTHQLNVHLAAFGHPIVGDATYGIDGDAAPNGGLTEAELDELVPNTNRASDRLQRRIAATGKGPCVHAKSLKFEHPVSREEIAFIADAPF